MSKGLILDNDGVEKNVTDDASNGMYSLTVNSIIVITT